MANDIPLNSLNSHAQLLKSSLDYQHQPEDIVNAIQEIDGLTVEVRSGLAEGDRVLERTY